MAAGPHIIPTSGGTPVALDRDQVTIGRMPDNDIQLGDPKVSRYHARFERRGQAIEVRDLESGNGTFVNDRRVQGAAPLREGDTIRFADTSFRIYGLPVAQTGYSSQQPQGLPAQPASQSHGLPAQPQPVPPPQVQPPYTPPPQSILGVAQPVSWAALEAPGEPPVVLTQVQTVFGHAPTCDFVFADPAIAPRHALIGRQNDDYFLIDLGGDLGTFVNGQRLTAPYVLRPGDRIQIGRVGFWFRRG